MALYAEGKIKPTSRTLPLSKAADAIRHLASRKAMASRGDDGLTRLNPRPFLRERVQALVRFSKDPRQIRRVDPVDLQLLQPTALARAIRTALAGRPSALAIRRIRASLAAPSTGGRRPRLQEGRPAPSRPQPRSAPVRARVRRTARRKAGQPPVTGG